MNVIKIFNVFRKFFLVLALFFFSTLNSLAYTTDKNSEFVAFDLDETLICSDKLTNEDVRTARLLGYEIKTSLGGQEYIIRPGAFEILEYAKALGFRLMIFTNNRKEYAQDILASSGLLRYFDKIISNDEVKQKYNRDATLYPNHRNFVHDPGGNKFAFYSKGFFTITTKKSFQRWVLGNKNIHPYFPSYYSSKYPPIFGTRVLIDNSTFNVENPLDFVGIKVTEFFGQELEPRDEENNFIWVENLKKDLKFLYDHDWIELYKLKYNKAPVIESLPVQALEKFSENLLDHTTVAFFGERTAVNDLYLSIS